jgi:hypothetical protein
MSLSTGRVARLLGVAYWKLNYLIRVGHIPAPTKGDHGFDWSDADVERARLALAASRPGARPKAVTP